MKRSLSLLIALIAFIYRCGAADAEAERLRQAYDAAVQRVVAPVLVTYQKELQKLMEKHTKARKLDDALAVKAELERVGGRPIVTTSPSSPVVAQQGNAVALRQKLLTGRFVFYFDPPRAKAMTFAETGEIAQGAAEQEKKWKLEGDDLFIYNAVDQVSHALRYHRGSDSFKASNRPALYKSRESYLTNADKSQ